MSVLTPFFNLFKFQKSDKYSIDKFNSNMDTIDTEMHRPPLTINGIEPDPITRNTYIEKVPLADNLSSDIQQINYDNFVQRMAGGGAPVEDGDASLIYVKGNLVRTGYVAESINMTVIPVERENPITAIIDRDTFVEYVESSGTIVLTYTTGWNADPANYGITVTGTPVSGDVITVVYVKEDRGLITTPNPTGFYSTGWNLYDYTTGIAKVIAYSQQYGYRIGGSYTSVKFATTLTGEQESVSVSDGLFEVAEDGYIFVTGGNDTTYIYPTWSDWINSYGGSFSTYKEYSIDMTEIMEYFPYGLCAVGDVRDEINFSAQKTVRRIDRIGYSAENLADIIAEGAAYIYDTNYIYFVLETPVQSSFSVSGQYTVSDHGIEYFDGVTIPLYTEILYGENLKNKLEVDVLTKSGDLVNNLTTNDSTKALSAAQGYALNSKRTQKTTASGTTTSSGALLCSIPSGGIIVAMNVTSDVGKIALKRSGDYIHIYTPDNSGLLPYANQNVSVDIYYQIFS